MENNEEHPAICTQLHSLQMIYVAKTCHSSKQPLFSFACKNALIAHFDS